MSLDYKLAAIDDNKSVCFQADGTLKPVTQSIVWATMSVEMGDITEANAGEFWARANLYQKYIGPWFRVVAKVDNGDDQIELKPVVLTEADIIAHIGLHTNVVSRTRRQWLNSYLNSFIEDDAITVRRMLGRHV